MSTLLRSLSSSCSTVPPAKASPVRKVVRASCSSLLSNGGIAVLGSILFAAGCSGEVGDLFPRDFDPSSGNGGSAGRATGVSSGGSAATASAGRGGAGGSAGAPSAQGGSAGQGGSLSGGGGAGAAPVGAGARGGVGSGSTTSSGGVAGRGDSEPEPTCDPCPCGDGPFGEPEVVAGLGVGVSAFGPAPSEDGLTLFFSTIDGDEAIFFSTRESRANQFTSAALVPGVNDPDADDGTPFLSRDGQSLYFFSTRPGPGTEGDRDLWVAQRTGAGVAFGEPAVVPGVNGPGLEHLPRLNADGTALMFVSSRETENAGSNIFVAERASAGGPFGEAVELPGVNSSVRDEGFWLSNDGLTIFFASNRVSEEDMDIWVALRPSLQAAFGEPEPLDVVNTPGIEIDPALTADGFELFFASDRSGTMQLYRSARSCP